jgi:hypothetical protein
MAQSSREIYWSASLADSRRSGLTQVEFCRPRRFSIHDGARQRGAPGLSTMGLAGWTLSHMHHRWWRPSLVSDTS